MFKHQQMFAAVLLQMYEPIPGKFTETSNESKWGSRSSLGTKNRVLTAELSMDMARKYEEAARKLYETLVPELVEYLLIVGCSY